MHKFIVMLLLAAASSSAAGEWLWLGVREYTTTYFDFMTISRTDSMAKVWILVDYQSPPAQNFTKPYRSHKEQIEFDCEKAKMRPIALIFYSNNMGEGEAVYSENIAGTWMGRPNGSVDGFLMKIACGKE